MNFKPLNMLKSLFDKNYFKSPDLSLESFEFLHNHSIDKLLSILESGVSKRQLIKTIKDLYTSKGTIDGHKYFFRLLFDEEAEIVFPRDNMLRVSDGFWDTEIVMKVIETGTSDRKSVV